MASAVPQVKSALEMLQSALPKLPMGSPIHTEILNAVKNIGKHIDEADVSPSQQNQQLRSMIQKNQQGAQLAALARMAQSQQPTPPQAPSMPQPDAAAA